MEEKWKDVVGFEGSYKVSNLGQVKSLDRVIVNSKGILKRVKGKLLTPTMHGRGYLMVYLSIGHGCRRYIHRVVAEAFITNDKNLLCINHKNEIKTDNRVENLEWCSNKYNLSYSGNITKAVKASLITRLKPVAQIKDSKTIAIFSSIKEAGLKTGIDHRNISKCHKGKSKTAGGYKWEIL